MYTLMLVFGIVATILGMFLYGKLNILQFAAIALVLALLIMFVPAIVQHASLTKDMELVTRNGTSKTYYCESEDRYYEISHTNGWIPWDLYEVKLIEKVVVTK